MKSQLSGMRSAIRIVAAGSCHGILAPLIRHSEVFTAS